MDRQAVFDEIMMLIVEADDTVNTSAIRMDDTTFKAYGLTSLTQVQLSVLIEDRFGVEVTDNDTFAANTPLRLVKLVEERMT